MHFSIIALKFQFDKMQHSSNSSIDDREVESVDQEWT